MFDYIGDHFGAFVVASMMAFMLVLGAVSILETIERRRQS